MTKDEKIIPKNQPLKIWVDADACPKIIKDAIFKAALSHGVPVCLVANSFMSIPTSPLITLIKVAQGPDNADFYIAENASKNCIVITADIPLAAIMVEKGAKVIDPRGDLYTEENVGPRLSMRDFMQNLRDSGVNTGGPVPISPKDKQRFTNSLDRLLTKMIHLEKS